MLFIIPPVPVKNTWRERWIWWWMDELKKLGVQYKLLVPNNWHMMLDSTNGFKPKYYERYAPVKFSLKWDANAIAQLANIIDFITYKDYLLVLDFNYTGAMQGLLPLLKRYRDDLKIAAYAHTGTWFTHNTYFAGNSYQPKKFIDYASALMLDKLFLATHTETVIMMDYLCYTRCFGDWYCSNVCSAELAPKLKWVGTLWRPYREINEALKNKDDKIADDRWIKNSKIVAITCSAWNVDKDLLNKIIEQIRGKVTLFATDKWIARMFDLPLVDYYRALSVAKVALYPVAPNSEARYDELIEALYTKTVPVIPFDYKNRFKEVFGEYMWEDGVEGIFKSLDNYEKYIVRTRLSYEKLYSDFLQAPRKIVDELTKG